MRTRIFLCALITAAHAAPGCSKYSFNVTSSPSYSITISNREHKVIVSNTEILTGDSNSSVTAIGVGSNTASVYVKAITNSVAQVRVRSSDGYIGATFSDRAGAKHYGVWGYPWGESLQNRDVSFDLKGLQGDDGINYSSARSPVFISSTGYAVYVNTTSMGSYVFSADNSMVQFIFNSTELLYYIILPDSEYAMKSLLTQYARLTDTTALWPASAYGPMFWHNDFESSSGYPSGVNNAQEFVQDVVDKLYDNRITASTIMVDRPYGTGTEGWGNFDFDTEFWPDIASLIANISSAGLDFQVWVANRAVPESELYEESAQQKWLFTEMATKKSPAVALNLSKHEAYSYFKERMAYFTKIGVKGYKIDRGDEDEMPVYEQNLQTLIFHELLYQNQAETWGGATTSKPAGFYNFARSLSDRSRKYAGVWGGDPESTFDGLQYSLRNGIRSGLIGFPVWGCDCGGYTRKAGKQQPNETVWARWMWFSTFTPVYEVMLFDGSIPWYDYSGDLVEVLRETAQLHRELIPFIQSYVFRATLDGLPLMRALFLEAENDDHVWDVDDAYFFGEELLVAPIVTNDNSRTVYFPKGAKYLEYFNKTEVYQGGSESTFTMGVHAVPVFVREGSIVPRGDLYQFNNKWEGEWTPRLNIEVFPSFTIEKQVFRYYSEKTGKATDITMNAVPKSRNICVSYGDLGAEGKLVLYVSGGPKEFELLKNRGRHCLDQVRTLFK